MIPKKTEKMRLPSNIRKYGLLIDGEIIDTGNYEYFLNQEKVVLNTRETLKKIKNLRKGIVENDIAEYVHAIYSVGDKNTTQKALEAASKAFQHFQNTTMETRVNILRNIREELKNQKDIVIRLMIAEGLPISVSEWEFNEILNAFSDKTLNFYKDQIVTCIRNGDKQEEIQLHRKPDGVLGVFLPKNAPASSSFLALFALIVGNTIIVKPPFKIPTSVLYIWQEIINKIIVKYTKINGVVNVIVGNSQEVLEQWLDSPLLNDILYFGSSKNGIEVAIKAFKKNKKVVLELSGNDFLVAWSKNKVDKAAISFLDGFISSTQVCMLPRIALVHEQIIDMFLENIMKNIEDIKIGPPSMKETILSPVANIVEFGDFLNDALSKGAKLLRGGKRVNYSGKEDPRGHYIEPTLVFVEGSRDLKNMRLYFDEAFFPLLTIVKLKGRDDNEIFNNIVKLINECPFGLRTSIWIDDEFYKKNFIKLINNSGMIRINSRHVEFSEYLPTHGGVGLTGGPYGGLNYLWERTSHLQGISIKE